MKASQICETTEWITHRDLANKIYMHTGNRQLAMEFYNLEDEFVSQDDMQSTGLKAFDVDPFEEDKARVNRILSIKRVPFRVLAMKHNDQYETLYSIVAPAMAESMYINEAQRVFVIVRKKDGALLQKFDNKKEAEKELIAGTGYSPAKHYIKAMLDPQQTKAEKDPTHIGEDDEMGGGEKLGRLIGRLKNIGLTGGAISIFIKNILYAMNNPDSKEGQALQGILKGLTTPSTMIGYFATLGVIGVGVAQLYKLQRWLLVNLGGLIGKTFDVPSKIRKKVSEADIRAFPTPEDYPIAKMDKLLRRYGVDYSMFINKPFDIKLYELLIDIYMNWEGSRIDRGALYYFTNQYRDRGVRAGELPPSDK
jgi:hypothetical protein